MEILRQLNKFTKVIIVSALIFILYGYLCRVIELYFFWESKSIGWGLLFIGSISFLFNRIKIKKIEKKNTVLDKIGIGVIIFILLIQTIFISVIPFTDAYSVAKKHLINDETFKNEVGNISGFGLIPTGGIQITSDSHGEYGVSTINLTVKGYKKFKDLTVYVVKYADSTEWEVEGME